MRHLCVRAYACQCGWLRGGGEREREEEGVKAEEKKTGRGRGVRGVRDGGMVAEHVRSVAGYFERTSFLAVCAGGPSDILSHSICDSVTLNPAFPSRMAFISSLPSACEISSAGIVTTPPT